MGASGKSSNRRSEWYRGYFGTGGNGPYVEEGKRAAAEEKANKEKTK